MTQPFRFFAFHIVTTAIVFLIVFGFLMAPALAQTDPNLKQEIEALKLEIQTLKKTQNEKNQTLVDEISKLKLYDSVPELSAEEFSHSSLGQAASKVYRSKSKVSIGGYAELVYYDDRDPGQNNTTDIYRLIPYIGYRFNNWIVFNSEIEFEHGGANADSGEGVAIIEFMYLDFLLHEAANIRIGNYLIPVGITNLKHEPTYFGSVNRPLLEKNLIPTTWHENGVLVYGDFAEDFSYQAGFFASPIATETGTATYKASSWIRSGRQKGARAKAEDFSGVFRMDYSGIDNTHIGFSGVYGDTSHDYPGISNIPYSLWEIHFETQQSGLKWNGLYTQGTLDGVGELAINSGLVGEEVVGWYSTLEYDTFFHRGGESAFPVFVRYSEYDLNKSVSTGVPDKTLKKKITTIGFNYKPHPQVVLKADFQAIENDAAYEGDQFSLGMGLVF